MNEVQYEPVSTATSLSKYVGEPYRFQCPECGAHSVILRTQFGFPAQYKEVQRTIRGTEGTVKDYRCNPCGATFNEVYDKKKGELRASVHK